MTDIDNRQEWNSTRKLDGRSRTRGRFSTQRTCTTPPVRLVPVPRYAPDQANIQGGIRETLGYRMGVEEAIWHRTDA